MKEYALYDGDKYIYTGTAQEIADHLGISKSTVYCWRCASYMKRYVGDRWKLIEVGNKYKKNWSNMKYGKEKNK